MMSEPVPLEGGSARALVAQLLQAAKCPPGAALPPGTADAAWQLSELVLHSVSILDVEAKHGYLEQLMSSVQPLLEA
eukprot:SAG11_NODE_19692_length_461_cov_0.709945_2_plen_76_part_01